MYLYIIMSTTNSLAVNFLMGGTIVSSVSYLASFVSPLIAAILWSYPFSILPTVYFMKQHSKSNSDISKFLMSASAAFILLFATTMTAALLLKRDTTSSGIGSIAKATGVWVIGAIIFYIVIQSADMKHHFT
jgi:hypothetical protein